MLENGVAISKLFERLKNNINTKVTLKTHAIWKIPHIDENSTLGEQIKYYRRLKQIKQSELSKRLGVGIGCLQSIENKEKRMVDIKLLLAVLKELDIEDKVNINDDYLAFLINDSAKTIKELRKKFKLTRMALENKIDIPNGTIKRWENGYSLITRKSYNKIKKVLIEHSEN